MKNKIIVLSIATLALASMSFAAGYKENITVYKDTVKKIIINGEDKTPTENKPFIYENTTYVPLRYVSEALGEEVHWDDSTQTIYIGERPIALTIEKNKLNPLPTYGAVNIYAYRLNNSVLPYDNLDNDAGFDYPVDFKMTYVESHNIEKTNFINKDNGISYMVSKGESGLYYKLGKESDVFTAMIGYDGNLNKGNYDETTIKVYVDNDLRQEIKLNATKHYAVINVPTTNGEILKIDAIVDNYQKIENRLMKPIINLTDMTLEKHIYK